MEAIPVVPIITGVEVQTLIVNVVVAWTTESKVIKYVNLWRWWQCYNRYQFAAVGLKTDPKVSTQLHACVEAAGGYAPESLQEHYCSP